MLTKLATLLWISILSLCVTQTAQATVFRDVLEYGNNASMIGIGKIEGFTPHAGVLFENAAALTHAQSGLSVFYINAMDDRVTAMTGAISHHILPNVSVGFGVARESSGSLDLTGEEDGRAVSLETFEYTNSAYVAGLGVDVSKILSLGVIYTLYDKQIYTVRGQGSDLGFSAHFDFKDTDLLLNAKNIGGQPIHYSEGDDETLFTEYGATLGHSFAILDALSATLMGQIKLSAGLPVLKNAGIRIYPFEKTLTIGLGYQESRGLGSQIYGGLTFGIDLLLSGMTVSYAYQATQYVAQDQAHHFSIFFGF